MGTTARGKTKRSKSHAFVSKSILYLTLLDRTYVVSKSCALESSQKVGQVFLDS